MNISEESEVEILKPHVSNNKSEKGKAQVSKLPQRVPRKEKGAANSGASGSEVNNTDNTMVQDGPNFNTDQDVKGQNKGIGQDVRGQNEAEKTGENVKEKSKTSKKDKKVKEKNEKAVEMADRRGTFVVTDAKELNLQAKICTSNKSGVEEDDSEDRRKTFVKPQSPKVDVKNDRRGTFVVPAVPSENPEEPEPMEDEDQTRYFNTDMEMTEVLSFSQPISSISSSESMNKSNESSGPGSAKKTNSEENGEEKTKRKDDVKEKSKENSQKNSGKVKESSGKSNLEVLKNKLQKIKSTDSMKSSKASKDESEEATDKSEEKKETEANGKSVVEMRVSKPGNFEYRVSRKQEDGTRQPVPLKPVSRSRSKGKVKLSKSTSDVITSLAKTPGKPKNVFDFGDRTPTVTLDPRSLYDDTEKNDEEKKQEVGSEKAEKDQKSKKEGNKKSSKEERKSGKSSGEVNGWSAQSVKGTKLLPDNPVYYVPLAKGSPAVVKEPARQSRRSRSKPRSYKEASSDEDDLEEEEGEVKSKAKGRGRSKSRKRHSSGGEEEKSSRRTRSQSRGRRDRKKEEEEDGENQPVVEKNKRQSRGRSRTRKNNDEDEEKGEDKVIKERASRSRTRKAAEVQETDEKKDDTEEVKIIRKTRSRSRARSVKRNVKETEDCVTKDSNTAAKEEESENRCNEIQTEGVEKSSSGEKPRKSSRQFLESLRKSTDIGEKVEKQQTKAFLASLVNEKEKNTEGRKSTKHAEVLASSSSEEDVQDKMVEEGQRMSVNESLVDDVDEEKTKSATVKDKSNKRKHHEVDDDRHCKEKVEDRKQKAETVKESTRDTQEKVKDESVKKTEEKDNGRSQSGKQKDAKVTDKSKGPDSTVSEVSDRLSQFVRERGHPKPMMMEDDDDITFSDFDKLYKHVSAKRASNSNTDEKLDDQEAAREDPKEEKKENGGKEVEPENLNLKTPSMSRPKSTKSAAKSRSKKSSKKNSSEKKVSEKENSVEEVSKCIFKQYFLCIKTLK